ncbi:MAG: hypothetical protein ACI9YT_002415 [Halobacteriales archaeon]|jgi:hypothetical protein
MSVPGLVDDQLGEESVTARISLGGEDELYVTPTRTLVYRGEGLLRDESIEEYSHDAERVAVSEGRRKTRFTLEYAIDGEREFTVPSSAAEKAMTPLLEGILTVRDVIEEDEDVVAAYRFSELTLVITERRLVKHVGTVLLDPDYEEFRYEDVTNLDFEQGSVAMQIVLTVDGRAERIKAPNDRSNEVRLRLETALQDFYDVTSNEELQAVLEPEAEADADADSDAESDDEEEMAFEAGIDLLGSSDDGASSEEPDRETEAQGASENRESSSRSAASADLEEAGFESVDAATTSSEDIEAELEALREAVERQNDLLAKQQQTIERLIEELSRGR